MLEEKQSKQTHYIDQYNDQIKSQQHESKYVKRKKLKNEAAMY